MSNEMPFAFTCFINSCAFSISVFSKSVRVFIVLYPWRGSHRVEPPGSFSVLINSFSIISLIFFAFFSSIYGSIFCITIFFNSSIGLSLIVFKFVLILSVLLFSR